MSRVTALRLESPGGARRSVVLKRYDSYEGDAAGALAHEAAVLRALEAVDLPTPTVVALCDEALLTDLLPGGADLVPLDMTRKLARMAEAILALHSSHSLRAIAQPAVLKPRQYEWVRDPAMRTAAEALVAKPPEAHNAVPTHGDFQHFNMLWSRGKLTGLLDWSGIWMGPPEIDVSHCRLNLAVLYSVEVAEQFRTIYESVAGRAVDPWHDVYRLGNYSERWPGFIPTQVHGRAPIPPRMTDRVEQLLRVSLAQL